MLKPVLEKFDSPIVMVNQQFEGQDWGVITSYCSVQDVLDSEGELTNDNIGWDLRVTTPGYDDLCLEGVFPSPEAAIEFAIERITSGELAASLADDSPLDQNLHPFGRYHSIV
ncbi:MAG: hypothetical protein KDI68_10075 [Gammaproteobacteria bacterium]|nr:hypothetical protein [Gammaproteobacteria bacterium]